MTRAATCLEPLGGAGEIEPACARIRTLLVRDHALVELAGARRSEAVDALFGAHVLAASVAASVTVRMRAATAFDYEVRWPDGRIEKRDPDDYAAPAAALVALDGDVARADEAARAAEERLRQARADVDTRAPRSSVAMASSQAPATAAAAPTAIASSPAPATASSALAIAGRSWLRRLFARSVAWFRARFGRGASAPAPAIPFAPARRAGALSSPPSRPPAAELGRLEAELGAAKASLAKSSAERDERRRALERYHADRDRQGRARLVELTTSPAPGWIELDIGAPALPPGVVLILRPAAAAGPREPLDATLFVDAPAAAAPLADDHPTLRVEHPPARPSLLRQLQLLRGQRAVAVARRLVATLCLCRNRILDLDRRARTAHEERTRELAARRVDEVEVVRREESGAQLPIARDAEQIVQNAAARLEALLQEVRSGWQERLDSCAGIEQLRAEVAAIEDGAAHRLALVCDELRETITIQFVRLVLELSRPLRQELMRRRLEVARGRSPKLEQTFDDIRVVLPASLDATFGALETPKIGELLSGERGLFDPLFRTLPREKRQCVTRLCARLDDIERTTARDLYAAAVFVSPLILATFKGLLSELIGAHQRWIDALVAEEDLAWQKLCARHAPALALVKPLELAESQLAALLEVV